MQLPPGGIDIFYIDESHDQKTYVTTAIRVPFLRNIDGNWTIVWQATWEGARDWRRGLKRSLDIPTTQELHGHKLASGRGNYRKGKHNFDRAKARGAYNEALQTIDFLPSQSIMSASVHRGPQHLYGNQRLEAVMVALFQRMRTYCDKNQRVALTFFDRGHPEYRTLYRKAQVFLPTGSLFGTRTRNLPLSMFFEDGNDKDSKHCWFTQTADIVAYVAFLKVKSERRDLTPWQVKYNWSAAYDEIPATLINTNVSRGVIRDGIVRL